MNNPNFAKRLTTVLAVLVLISSLIVPAIARPGGSFGGGGRSFGGGGSFGGGRSFGGSSFGGGGRSFGGGGFSSPRRSGSFGGAGAFGGSSRSSGSFGAPRSSAGVGAPRSSSSSFGRTGGFGSSGRINSTSYSHLPSGYRSYSYSSPTNIYIGGRPYMSYGYGGFWSGYSLGLLSTPWYGYMPFHPAFYVDRPYYDNQTGAYYAGGFSFTKFIFGIFLIILIIWVISRIFGGGKRVKYTVYR